MESLEMRNKITFGTQTIKHRCTHSAAGVSGFGVGNGTLQNGLSRGVARYSDEIYVVSNSEIKFNLQINSYLPSSDVLLSLDIGPEYLIIILSPGGYSKP